MNLAEKIVDRVERRELMKENEIDIRQKQVFLFFLQIISTLE
jgi:hypothetical protein